MPQCIIIIIIRQFFRYTEVTCQLQYIPLVHTLKVLKTYHYCLVTVCY